MEPIKAILLLDDAYGAILVDDYDNFKEMFDIKGSFATLKNLDWHPMCGGFDTWLQSNAVGHARSGIPLRKLNTPYLITHIYRIKYD